MTDDLSAKMRIYLAEIYRLYDMEEPENGYISTSSLADLLLVSAPAVNRMVNRLKDQDLLHHEPYQGIRLTKKGNAEALAHLRAHRIAEAFLVRVMGLEWDDVYDEANAIATTLSDKLLDRMAAMAGNPDYCPHGEPIPTAAGEIQAMNDVLLSEVEPEQDVTITRMRTRQSDRLNYLSALGLLPGTTLEVLHRAPFNGPMQLKIHGEYRIIGHNLAELVRVRPSQTAS